MRNLLLIAILAMGFAACKKNDANTIGDVVPVDLTVKLSFDADSVYGFSYDKAVVKITNLTNNQAFTQTATATGAVTFKGITPGNYDVAATLTISAADYNAKAGTNVQEAIVYNATLIKQAVVTNKTLAISLKTGRVGDLVIKQIYYAGSNAANGAVFRDQFLEIYNNSSETLYADSLCISQVMGNNTAATNVDQTKGYFQASGQYDWTKSFGMSNAAANTGYIYAKTIFMIPGTGKQHAILPGKSIIIAATALNHKAPFTGTDGKTVSVKDPTLTIDLSAADFEVYLGNYPGINPLSSDVDNPDVPNVTVLSNNGNRDLILDNLGRDGVVIFRASAQLKNWPTFATPDVAQVTASTNLYTQVPVSVIIDGVGLQHAVTASRIARRIPDVIDAGETFVAGGSYSSQSVVRKTGKTVSGRIVLKDTNNSTNDFGTLTRSDPSKGATSFIN